MDKYPARNFLLNIFIHNKLLTCGGMTDWETRDSRLGLGLYRLVSSRMVLIRLAVLGNFMVLARRWASAGAGPIE